jgi:hypothetical protein
LTASCDGGPIEIEVEALIIALAHNLDLNIHIHTHTHTHMKVDRIVSGPQKGKAYDSTARFCDKWGHRQAGSDNLEKSLDDLNKNHLEPEGLSAQVLNLLAFLVQTYKY